MKFMEKLAKRFINDFVSGVSFKSKVENFFADDLR